MYIITIMRCMVISTIRTIIILFITNTGHALAQMRLLKIGGQHRRISGQYFVVLCGGDLLAQAAGGIDPSLEVGVVDGSRIVTLTDLHTKNAGKLRRA
jgi:hypothetical protein